MKTSLVASIAILFSLSTLAETSTYTKSLKRSKRRKSSQTMTREIEKDTISNEKTLLLQIGSVSGDLTLADGSTNESAKQKGIELSAGRLYNFNDSLEGMTALKLRSTRLEADELSEQNLDWDLLDLNIEQKISIVTGNSAVKFKPFIAGGIGRGQQTIGTRINEDGDNGSLEIKNNYTRLSYGAGLDVEFENGLTPYVSYQVSRLSMDNNATVEGNVNGVAVNETMDTDFSDFESKTLMIGLGYRF